ncbi:MAG: hypothetical protein LUO93_06820 [Methanomicrobiales archaeon]|nr:hypothetical protein [Methanomicrobiales archaeon]
MRWGYREATDIPPNETIVGFPIEFLLAIIEHLEYLDRTAIPRSREKRALAALKKQGAKAHSGCTTV